MIPPDSLQLSILPDVLSWNLCFGVAVSDIEPGQYVCNERVLEALRGRGVSALPDHPNFRDEIRRLDLNDESVKCEEVPQVSFCSDLCLLWRVSKYEIASQ